MNARTRITQRLIARQGTLPQDTYSRIDNSIQALGRAVSRLTIANESLKAIDHMSNIAFKGLLDAIASPTVYDSERLLAHWQRENWPTID